MPTAQTLPTVFSGSASGWDASLYAFLAEKQRRSGSNPHPGLLLPHSQTLLR